MKGWHKFKLALGAMLVAGTLALGGCGCQETNFSGAEYKSYFYGNPKYANKPPYVENDPDNLVWHGYTGPSHAFHSHYYGVN